MAHLLNLRELAGEPVESYALLGFEGREAISEPFEYRLELIATTEPDLSAWIGKLAEFDVSPDHGSQRVFAGRIYGARWAESGDERRIHIQIRPSYHALSYARATHFVQDKNTLEIFDAMTADVTGLVKAVSVSPPPPKRGYAVRYDETELDFLARMLAQDGIMYFFAYERGAGSYRHKMIVTNKPADYIDLPGGAAEFLPNSDGASIDTLERRYRAAPRKHGHVGFNVNKLDTPFPQPGTAADSWGAVYSHAYETTSAEAVAKGDVKTRQEASDEHVAQSADFVEGTSTEPGFQAGGRVEVIGGGKVSPKRVVLTSVVHSAYDPWMLEGEIPPHYANRFTAIDATKTFRPSVELAARRAPGPILGTIALKGAAEGEAKIDDQWRVPVAIANARDYSGNGLPEIVWLPVQQQWAHSTHGAQFFPRIGSRVIIDFLYGNPDLPFIAGSVFTPSQKYPFDPTSTPTQSGWRSITDKNGSIVQEFRFEDKPGEEEVYLYTGRDYRRVIDNDDWGTVKRDQTLIVERDQKLNVTKDRTVKIEGLQKTDITKTRTMTVLQESLHESKKEIELKVGPSSIKLTMQGIEIKAPTIKITSDATMDLKAGAMATFKAALIQETSDGPMILKGAIVMIN
ncbi:type VI secretion system Vgr family protein [Sphingomonas radiodurans]|uniref:type VI secretion system Vgr family protein n=1 Tax=Sphingomonas radiodurans TaxID=2890321 RepID=UPI001E41E4FE|nr:type VI secretion system tip protein TssI/VgrG [Sphingomonas radiodurans]WBH16694.1 type VI secretion system tip protein TssI/VgrG [Sphingomonas radiodurans]